MRIALIGMSGTGKSYWSHRLARNGFERFGCDDQIGGALARQLGLPDGSIEAIGKWMGFPYEAGFEAREAQYLELEQRMLAGFLEELEDRPEQTTPSVVVDTTGSVIYLGEALLAQLCRRTVVVYLSAPPARREKLLAAYRACPRPVVWNGFYRQNPGEDTADALARSYMALLDDRDRRYRHCAHVAVELPGPVDDATSPETLLAPVRAYLQENAPHAAP